ncbi:HD-GYP domain-containing protein [Cohnella sp. WQ 127256]|uniref:HD-GYP domain-containing protein n=1 Tax=Cohnella sp. WQ 127256 TaxID=2938790 RepID=UPI002117391B|nr:HD-GYP domain-containing protein [Cohnella sp. WQ 127256]
MLSERKKLLHSYYQDHQRKLSLNILRIALIYLLLSISWNAVFLIFQVQYSRANIYFLLLPLIVLLLVLAVNRIYKIKPIVIQHVVNLFLVFVACCLYYGSGYREAWGYFLAIPILAGLYGNLRVLFLYSTIGLVTMFTVTFADPLVLGVFDSIDFSNRVLLYLVLGTFSYLLPKQLNQLYNNQVNSIIHSMETTIEQVVKTFIISIEAKDSYTFGHSERVSKYAVALALRLPEFQDKQRLETLRLSGLLHDIGKINIPEAVLTKTDKLSEEEYELIKTHAVVGGRMVEKISGLGHLKPGVLYHHERWDGEGYPTGAKGKDIPLEARILSIADAFDAITSTRSYRPANTPLKAIERLKDNSGTHFDPDLIKHLDEVMVSWIRIYKEYNEDLSEFETLLDMP